MNSADVKSASNTHWAELKEAGTLKGLLFLAWVQKVFGRGVYSLILLPVSLYFFLFRPLARRSSRDFLLTHYRRYPQGWKRQPSSLDVVRHFYTFGQSVMDKLLAWTMPISEEDFDIEDETSLRDFIEDDRGQLVIGSHLGNLEFCRGFVKRYKKQKSINALVYDRHSANYVEMMQRLNPDSRISVYQVDELDIPLILTLKSKIDAGEWLFVAGDRVPLSGGQRTVEVDFFERKAKFPIGPYMLAKALECKVKLIFSYRHGSKVRFSVSSFAEKIELPRKDRQQALQHYAQLFASALENQAAVVPLQWFNFYPFWTDGPK